MSDLQTILAALEQLSRRLRLRRAMRLGFKGLLWGSAASLLLSLAYRLLPIPEKSLLLLPLFPIVGGLAGALCAWRKPTLPQAARQLDQSAHLEERLSTAMELAGTPDSNDWKTLVLTDAARRVRDLDQQQLMPLNLPASGRWSAALLALCIFSSFIPVYRSPAHIQRAADATLVRQTGRQLAELTRHSLETRPPALEPVRQALDSIANTGTELEKKILTRAEALQDLASLSDKLQEQVREMAANPALQRLEKAARSGAEPASGASAEMQQRLENLRRDLGAAADSPDKLESLRSRLEKLQKEAQSAGSADARQKVGEALAALARDAQSLGIDSSALDNAIAALAANQPGKFVKDIGEALNDLEKLREMSAAMRQLQAQMQKLGKDLAEQLEAGQIAAAQTTLKDMVKSLQSADLSPEQLQKIMQQVAQAVQPATDYGKVSELLRQAGAQMKSGQSGAAAASLAAAAEELASLKQQFDDIEQLAKAMQNLNCASACISSGKSWGACRRPGSGASQRPGTGVGTWAADGLLDSAPQNQRWDNSGINRPDMNPRGLSDRGSGEGSTDGMKPDQVKGQISRGAPMPAITLKGLSIRGQSRVALEEAAVSAQQEAQAALSQERVPRAYQAPVKDYFDDLKNQN